MRVVFSCACSISSLHLSVDSEPRLSTFLFQLCFQPFLLFLFSFFLCVSSSPNAVLPGFPNSGRLLKSQTRGKCTTPFSSESIPIQIRLFGWLVLNPAFSWKKSCLSVTYINSSLKTAIHDSVAVEPVAILQVFWVLHQCRSCMCLNFRLIKYASDTV